MQFTIGQDTHDKLRRLQALMRREIPDGDVAVIFEQAVDLMLEKVEKAKMGAKARRRPTASAGTVREAYENRIRFRTDDPVRLRTEDPGEGDKKDSRPPSRHIPSAVKRAVWYRDGGQCAFVSADGRRCTECAFLELHHIQPYALGGAPSVGNLALRCRRHNAYEAALVFGPRVGSPAREGSG